MIETKNSKKFFTYEKNLTELIAFSKVFNAQISIVKIPDEVEILDLEEIVPRFCEGSSSKSSNIIKIKPKPIKISTEIKNYIKENLIKGNVVSLKDLMNKFKSFTAGYLCNYFTKVRNELTENGYNLIKVGGGKYKVKD